MPGLIRKEIENYILKGEYEKAKELCLEIPLSEMKESLLSLAYDSENISIYGFTRYMFDETKNTNWIDISCSLMIGPFCYIDGAYSVGLHHARQMFENNCSIENLEMLLFFYNIPEKLLDKQDAISIVEKILAIEPNNKIALDTIKDIG